MKYIRQKLKSLTHIQLMMITIYILGIIMITSALIVIAITEISSYDFDTALFWAGELLNATKQIFAIGITLYIICKMTYIKEKSTS